MVMVFQLPINLSKYRWLGCFAAYVVAFPVGQHTVVAQQNRVSNLGNQRAVHAMLVAPRNVPLQPNFVPIGTRSLVDRYRTDQRQQDLRDQSEEINARESQGQKTHLVRYPQSGFAAPPLPTTGPAPMAFPDNGGMGLPAQPVAPVPGFQEPTAGSPFGLPPGNAATMPMANPVTSPAAVAPPTGLPPALPMNPTGIANVPMVGLLSTQVVPRNADLFPISRPELNDGFATVGNHCCVSAPSSYVAAMGLGNCAGGSSYSATNQGYIATGPQVAAPPQMASPIPAGLVPVTRPSAPGVPKRPLINLGQNKNAVVVGQGIIGQPVAYVPGQCIRNWIRYISP